MSFLELIGVLGLFYHIKVIQLSHLCETKRGLQIAAFLRLLSIGNICLLVEKPLFLISFNYRWVVFLCLCMLVSRAVGSRIKCRVKLYAHQNNNNTYITIIVPRSLLVLYFELHVTAST